MIYKFEKALVDFYRFYDHKIGESPIPSDAKSEDEAWRELVVPVLLCVDGVYDIRQHLECIPLFKDRDDFKTILQYVIDEFPKWENSFAYADSEWYSPEELLNHLKEIMCKIDERPTTSK